MLKKVVYVALLVSDQDEALDFYTNVIGLEKRGDYPTPDGPRFLTVGSFCGRAHPPGPSWVPRFIPSRWRIA
jgi:catechol 2,3-dioxygenase-like lactoylglutathione lyase family enzyme